MATVDLADHTSSSVAQPGHSFRFRGRSFLAFALAPELPIGLPPLLKGGRTAGGIEVLDPPAPGNAPIAREPKPQATSRTRRLPASSDSSLPRGNMTITG